MTLKEHWLSINDTNKQVVCIIYIYNTSCCSWTVEHEIQIILVVDVPKVTAPLFWRYKSISKQEIPTIYIQGLTDGCGAGAGLTATLNETGHKNSKMQHLVISEGFEEETVTIHIIIGFSFF